MAIGSCCFRHPVPERNRLAQDLAEDGLNSFYTEDADREVLPGEILITHGNAQKGYEYPLIRFVVIAESDIFGQEHKKKKKRRRYEGKQIAELYRAFRR